MTVIGDGVYQGYRFVPCQMCALQVEHDRLRTALQEIAVGKVASDNENPYGEGNSMAGRFLSIAQRALQAPRKAGGPDGT